MSAERGTPEQPVRFAELDEATRQRAQIVVVHDRREIGRAGAVWVLSLTDISGIPIARERVEVVDGDPQALLSMALQYLYAVGMRVAGDWTTSADREQTRHYARVAACPSMN
jgi:hypothetical protein